MKTKITELVRAARLRRPLEPSVTKDSDIPGFTLHVTRTRGFWALSYQPKGVNPSTNRRWGGGVRHELGDAMANPRFRGQNSRADSQGVCPSRRKPPSRKTGLHGLRYSPASRLAINR